MAQVTSSYGRVYLSQSCVVVSEMESGTGEGDTSPTPAVATSKLRTVKLTEPLSLRLQYGVTV